MRLHRALALLVLASSVASADPSGKKWFTLPVTYRIASSVDNTGGTSINGGVAYSTVVGRTQAAFTNWGKTKVTNCPTTGGATTWDTTYTGQFASPSGQPAISSTDNFNSVVWLSGGSFAWGTSTLGITFTMFFTNGQLDEADMAMNNNVQWSDQCANAFNSFDYESVILHEAGHFLGLDHNQANSIAVMFPSVANGTCKRALQSTDISDVCTVYPVSSGAQGSSCTSNSNCTGGRVCKSLLGTTSAICTTASAAPSNPISCPPANCPTGYTCQNAQGGGQACLPQLGSADLCKFCSDGSQCSTGQCVTDGSGHFFCSQTCSSAATCGSGYNCVTTTQGGLCAPTSACTNQCTGTGQSSCPVGYACVSGRCDPTGNPGDHCELSEVCKTCGICVGTNAEAYCRSCCGGTTDCNTCPNAACGTNFSCTPLTNSTDKVCIPSSGAALCTACSTSSPCLNGLSCLAGKCHLSCNFQSPGTCSACFDNGGTNPGTCACSGEVATVGQVCGMQTNGSFFACQTGLLCVGTPATCKKTCTLGNNASCNQGEVCASVSGKAVCVPDAAGQRCAACASGGTPCAMGLSCNNGRCYETCSTGSATSCGMSSNIDCVALLGDGSGVCACNDQKVGVDQSCGANPIRSCLSGLKCIAGFCRSECNISTPQCSVGLECKAYAGAGGLPYCQSPVQGVGGGGGTSCVALNMACTMGGSIPCCQGTCVTGAGTTICSLGGTGGGSSGSGGSSGTGGGTTGCIANTQSCTTSSSCCSGNCASGAGGVLTCQPGQTGTGGNSGAGGGEAGGAGGSGTPSGGCACAAGSGGMAGWWLLSALAVGLWRRKRS